VFYDIELGDVLMVQRPLICQNIKANLISHAMTCGPSFGWDLKPRFWHSVVI